MCMAKVFYCHKMFFFKITVFRSYFAKINNFNERKYLSRMEWSLKKFHELTIDELYTILQLRSKVFIVEQHCIYNDVDGKDQLAWHLMGTEDGHLIAYTRILPPGV